MNAELLGTKERFNLEEAAAYLGMKTRALREACLDRRIAYSKLDRRTWLFTRAALDEFIRRTRFPVAPKTAKTTRNV